MCAASEPERERESTSEVNSVCEGAAMSKKSKKRKKRRQQQQNAGIRYVSDAERQRAVKSIVENVDEATRTADLSLLDADDSDDSGSGSSDTSESDSETPLDIRRKIPVRIESMDTNDDTPEGVPENNNNNNTRQPQSPEPGCSSGKQPTQQQQQQPQSPEPGCSSGKQPTQQHQQQPRSADTRSRSDKQPTQHQQQPNRKFSEYPVTGPGPHAILLESTDPTLNVANYHSMQLAKKLTEAGIAGFTVEKGGWRKIRLVFVAADDANRLLQCGVCETQGWAPILPATNTISKGIVRHLAPEITATDIIQGATTDTNNQIIAADRQKRLDKDKGEWVNTNTWKVVFSTVDRPSRVFLYGISLPVEAYTPPVNLCQTCGRYGHTKSRCKDDKAKENPICLRCGEKGHAGNPCPTPKPRCPHCKGPHAAKDPTCPAWNRERDIRKIMGEKNVSYAEAAKTQRHTSADEPSQIHAQPSNASSSQTGREFPPTRQDSQPGIGILTATTNIEWVVGLVTGLLQIVLPKLIDTKHLPTLEELKKLIDTEVETFDDWDLNPQRKQPDKQTRRHRGISPTKQDPRSLLSGEPPDPRKN